MVYCMYRYLTNTLTNREKNYIQLYKEEETMFNTYIDDKDIIPTLLNYGWMIMHDTWTDCPYPTYKSMKKAYQHNGNATIFGEMM